MSSFAPFSPLLPAPGAASTAADLAGAHEFISELPEGSPGDPKHEHPPLQVGRQAQLGAMGHIVVHRFMKSRFQLVHTAAVETYHVANARQVADKNAVFVIKFNAGAAGGRAPSGKR